MANVQKIAEEIVLIMPRISRKILADFHEHVDIPHAQLFVIMTLFHNGPSRASEIGKELNVAPPTASGIIDRLEKSGYVSRSADKSDRRASVVDLTAEGKKIALKLRTTAAERWADVLKKLPSRDAENYLDILRKIKEVL